MKDFAGFKIGTILIVDSNGYLVSLHDGSKVHQKADLAVLLEAGIVAKQQELKWTDEDMRDFVRWMRITEEPLHVTALELFGCEIDYLRKSNWAVYVPPVDNICSRCGQVIGDNPMSNFLIKIEAPSLATNKLLAHRGFDSASSTPHPAIHRSTHGQLAVLKGGPREPYHLCKHCHEEFLGVIGRFIDTNIER